MSTLPVHTPGHRGRTLILCFGLFSFGITYPKLDYTIKARLSRLTLLVAVKSRVGYHRATYALSHMWQKSDKQVCVFV